jgi:alpha-tubulin suppressor-like RCC1 family protein
MRAATLRLPICWTLLALGLGACTCQPQSTAVTDAVPVAQPQSLEFGPIAPGARQTLQVTLTNTGRSALHITSLELFGATAAAFHVPPTALTLGSGERSAVDVEFRPEAVGAYAAQLNISSDSQRVPVLEVSLVGWCQRDGDDGGLDAGGLDAGGFDAGGLDAGGLDAGGFDAGWSAAGPERVELAGGYGCAFRAGGPLRCWGHVPSGRAANGATATDFLRTAAVLVWDAGVVDVALGTSHLCALLASGSVECSGDPSSAFDDTSTGGVTMRGRPVTGLPTGITAVDTVCQGACALTSTGDAWCWGRKGYGLAPSAAPVQTTALAGAIALDCVGGTNCKLDARGALSCFGAWSAFMPRPDGGGLTGAPLTLVDSGVLAFAQGNESMCVRGGDGGVSCWGYVGQPVHCGLGDGLMQASATPVSVVGLTGPAVSIASGASSACAVSAAGQLRCWGCNGSGQLGDGTSSARLVPVPVLAAGGFRAVTVRGSTACGARPDGGAACWGFNLDGQLGRASGVLTNTNPTPASVDGL